MIVVGLTTIPERLEKGLTKKSIESILKQSLSPNYIVVNIPEISIKGKKYNYEFAKELGELDEKVVVRWGIVDEGPITKLFGTLDFINENKLLDSKILLVDDDVKYHEHMIETLYRENHPAVGFVGRKFHIENDVLIDLNYYDESYKDNIDITFLETFASVMYDTNKFNVNLMRKWLKELPEECFFVDDIIIGAWLWQIKQKPKKIVTNTTYYFHDAENTPQLNQINLEKRNVEVANKLYCMGYFRDHNVNHSFGFLYLLYCFVFIFILLILFLFVYTK